ncbi:hypothetical protein [Pseudomonas meliae]|uniref:Type III effector HopAT1 n=1 Tax=Pseudomonas meliae TaxID=86176 RepID=A0A0P9U5X1_9PSED|nr:hypothetical protein [Pseudomonas meliae]KPX82809.1 Type III effector HopAT1 [Pseudomonas meliae]
MVGINNWSSNLDAYRILQEAQSLTEEPPHFDTAFPIEPESLKALRHRSITTLATLLDKRNTVSDVLLQTGIRAAPQHVRSETPEITVRETETNRLMLKRFWIFGAEFE